MTDPPTDKLRPLRIRLTVVFLAALLIFGVPALYLWLVFTCLVMTSCILIAARTLWRDED